MAQLAGSMLKSALASVPVAAWSAGSPLALTTASSMPHSCVAPTIRVVRKPGVPTTVPAVVPSSMRKVTASSVNTGPQTCTSTSLFIFARMVSSQAVTFVCEPSAHRPVPRRSSVTSSPMRVHSSGMKPRRLGLLLRFRLVRRLRSPIRSGSTSSPLRLLLLRSSPVTRLAFTPLVPSVTPCQSPIVTAPMTSRSKFEPRDEAAP